MDLPPQPIALGRDRSGKKVVLTPTQRAYHTHVIGGIGRGKTTLLDRMIRQDIVRGHGLCLIDPHGGLYRQVLEWSMATGYAAARRIHLIDPAVRSHVPGFNPLFSASNDLNEILDRVDALMDAFSQVWGADDLARMPTFQRIFSALMFAIAYKRLTLVETPYLVPAERALWREYLGSGLPHPMIQAVWEEIQGYSKLEHRANFLSVFNRLDPFLRSPIIQHMLGQRERVIDLARVMDDGDIVLVNLQPHTGFSLQNATLLGRLLINNLYVTALRRVPEKSRPFYLYIDECHRYLSEDIEGILSECRKYGLHLTLAHQHLGQLKEAGELVESGVMNVAVNKIVFSLGMENASLFADELFGEQYDYEEPKKILMKPTVVGFRRIILRNAMESRSDTESLSRMQGGGSTEGASAATSGMFGTGSVTVFDANNNPLTIAVGSSEGYSELLGSMSATQESWSEGHTTSQSVARGAGWSEALEPVLEERAGGVYSLEEQRHRVAVAIHRQGKGEAAVQLLGEKAAFITTETPKKVELPAEEVAKGVRELLKKGGSATPFHQVEREIRERQAALEAAVRAHAGHPYTGGTRVELSPEEEGWGR